MSEAVPRRTFNSVLLLIPLVVLSLIISLVFSRFLSLSLPFFCCGIDSQSSVQVRSYEIPHRSVSAVIEYFYTAEFNSGLQKLNGDGHLGGVSRMKSSLRHHKFDREEHGVYPNNRGREPPENQHRQNLRLRITEYRVNRQKNNPVCRFTPQKISMNAAVLWAVKPITLIVFLELIRCLTLLCIKINIIKN